MRICYILCFTTIAVVAAGCTANRTADFGASQRLAVENQILRPEASRNMDPVTGMDGRTAQKVYEGHEKTFEKAQQPPTYLLSVGGQKK